MKHWQLLLFLIIGLHSSLVAQELYPIKEPASSVPKSVLGIRVFDETYREYGAQRNLTALRVLYGATARLSLSLSASMSNHHSKHLPIDLVSHTHNGNQTLYQTGTFQRGLAYSNRFNGFYVYAKYRFLSSDGQNTHYRMALYAEGSNVNAAHDETEPTLLDDTKGYGIGIISTYLKNHFSATFTGGIIMPSSYSETVPDFFGGTQTTKLQYGRAANYSVSLGYLLYPTHYKDYNQTNVNVYLELLGKSYESAKVFQDGNEISPTTALLLKGNYVEAHPGIQLIVKSNMRLDLSVGLPFIHQSYARFYPMYMLGIQRYFFFVKRTSNT